MKEAILLKLKKPGCLFGFILLIFLVLGFIGIQVLTNGLLYFLLTWPIWIGKAFDYCLEFAQRSTFNKVIVTSSFVLIGLLFYRIKQRALMIFGIIEFVGGVFFIWGSFIFPSSDYLINAIAISAGLFLIVQGLENYSKGEVLHQEIKN